MRALFVVAACIGCSRPPVTFGGDPGDASGGLPGADGGRGLPGIDASNVDAGWVTTDGSATSEDSSPRDAGGDAPYGDGILGMNDISMLLRLPDDPTVPTFGTLVGFGDGDLVSRDLFAHQVHGPDVPEAFEAFQVVAIRFDLCDRVAVGSCAVGADGQLRLTLQPMTGTPTRAVDRAMHVSYRIPGADLPAVIGELRALAALRHGDSAAPLAVNAAVVAGVTTDYTTRLTALVRHYAHADQVVRLTVMANPPNAAWWDAWILEPVAGVLQLAPIPAVNIESFSLMVQIETPLPSFDTSPVADIPAHITLTMSKPAFAAMTAQDQQLGFAAVNAVLNPTLNTGKTVECTWCHAATRVSIARATETGIDLATTQNRYTSSHDLSIAGGVLATDDLTVRAFAYRDRSPEISQRVANETAMVLDEIEARFPHAH